jgi:hypothetical protein
MREESIELLATHARLFLAAALAMVVDESFFGGTHGFLDFLGLAYLYFFVSVLVGNTVRRVIS